MSLFRFPPLSSISGGGFPAPFFLNKWGELRRCMFQRVGPRSWPVFVGGGLRVGGGLSIVSGRSWVRGSYSLAIVRKERSGYVYCPAGVLVSECCCGVKSYLVILLKSTGAVDFFFYLRASKHSRCRMVSDCVFDVGVFCTGGEGRAGEQLSPEVELLLKEVSLLYMGDPGYRGGGGFIWGRVEEGSSFEWKSSFRGEVRLEEHTLVCFKVVGGSLVQV